MYLPKLFPIYGDLDNYLFKSCCKDLRLTLTTERFCDPFSMTKKTDLRKLRISSDTNPFLSMNDCRGPLNERPFKREA